MSGPRRYLAATTVSLITFFVYLPALQNGFVNWDDGKYVFENPHIQSIGADFFRWAFFEFYTSNWHPLTWISHALDYALWGLNPVGHHLSSIVLHCLNAFLVTVVALRLFERSDTLQAPRPETGGGTSNGAVYLSAMTAGLLFGIHPLHVESVAWVSERKDVLCAFFFLLSIFSYIEYVSCISEKKASASFPAEVFSGKYMASLIFFFLALLSKPMAVALPFVLLILDWYPFGRLTKTNVRIVVLEKIPFLVLSIGSSIITLKSQNSTQGILMPLNSLVYPLTSRITTSFYVICSYLAKMLMPVELIPFYPYPKNVSLLSMKFLAPLLLVAVITIFCLLISRRQRTWAAIWLYYIVTLLPVLGVVKVGDQLMADRYTYLPSIGPFLLFGIGIALLDKRVSRAVRRPSVIRGVSISIVAVLCVCLSYATTRQIKVWKDAKTLWSHEIKFEQNFSVAYDSLGDAMLKEGRLLDAVPLFQRALQLDPVNMAARDGYTKALNTLAVDALRKKEYDSALLSISRAAELSPKNDTVYNTTGEIYFAKKEYEKAFDYFNSAISVKPDTPEPYYNAALALENLARWGEACKYWDAYLRKGEHMPDTGEVLQHMRELKCRN